MVSIRSVVKGVFTKRTTTHHGGRDSDHRRSPVSVCLPVHSMDRKKMMGGGVAMASR
jgi:hypothetical protein